MAARARRVGRLLTLTAGGGVLVADGSIGSMLLGGAFDYVVSAGYLKHGLNTEFSFRQQRMQSGGDIRRQDMPFVSNRMNFSQVGAMALYAIPKLRRMEVKFAFAYTVDGRNVGQGTTLMTALQYRFALHKGNK